MHDMNRTIDRMTTVLLPNITDDMFPDDRATEVLE
jgi:hypothetical protein